MKEIKMHFARYGIPDVVVSYNGPQFAVQEFQCFSKTWQFQLNTTSPLHPKSNGKEKNAVKAAKQLLKKAKGQSRYLSSFTCLEKHPNTRLGYQSCSKAYEASNKNLANNNCQPATSTGN